MSTSESAREAARELCEAAMAFYLGGRAQVVLG